MESPPAASNERVVSEGNAFTTCSIMRKTVLALLAAMPVALFAGTGAAQAYPWSYYGYSSPSSSYMMVNGPGGYSGYGFGSGNMGMYSDNYGTTTCLSTGYSVMCF